MFYPKRPEPFHKRINDIFHCLFEDEGQNLMTFTSLIQPIADEHPEIITAEQIDYTFEMVKKFGDRYAGIDYLFRILAPIANTQPHLFDRHRKNLIQYSVSKQSFSGFQCLNSYAIAKVILGDETTADEYLTLFINLIKTSPSLSNDLKAYIFGICQTIGARYKQVLAKKREALMPYKSNPACRMLIDYIDGNQISKEQQAAMNRTLDELNQMEKRIVHTEKNVKDVQKTIQRQELNVRILFIFIEYSFFE